MILAFSYLFQRFFYRIFTFFHHWYIKSIRIYLNFVVNRLERLDRVLAWRITLKYIFEPLYKDYSPVGRILGFLFRSVRLFLGSIAYGVIFLVALAAYLIWFILPIYFIFKVFNS